MHDIFLPGKKKKKCWYNQEASTVMVIFRKTKEWVFLHQVNNAELKLHKLTKVSDPLCVRSGGAYGE